MQPGASALREGAGGALVSLIGPAANRPESAARDAACAACHAAAATGQSASAHHAAFDSRAFQRAFAREPRAECRGCHAPEADPRAGLVQDDRSALGVGCVTCHAIGDAVLASPGGDEAGNRPAPHRTIRSAAFASPRACAGCHEFAFPGGRSSNPAELSQTTVLENDAAEAEACPTCHMRGRGDERVSHAFASVRDEAAWQRAFKIGVRRSSRGRVTVALQLRDAGHRLPTGDMRRRIRVRAEWTGSDYQLSAVSESFLGRKFELLADHACPVSTEDTRPLPGAERTVVFNVPDAQAGGAVLVTLSYERILFGDLDDPSAVADSTVLLDRVNLPPWGD